MAYRFVDYWLMLSGILDVIGTIGGIGFLIYAAVEVWCDRFLPLREDEKQERCESCQSYEACVTVMEDMLPDFPCAYWEKKKP